MDNTTKFLGAFLLFTLLSGHMLLLGFFFAPANKLLASVIPDTHFISSSDIPVGVQDFVSGHKIDVLGEAKAGDGFLSGLVLGLLELRGRRFMDDSERLALNMNLLHYDDNIIGIDSGSQYYFKKPVVELNDEDWITLLNLQKIFQNK